MLMYGRGGESRNVRGKWEARRLVRDKKAFSVLVPSINSPYIPSIGGEFGTLFQLNNQMVSSDQQTWLTPRGSDHVQMGSDILKGQAQRCVFDLSY